MGRIGRTWDLARTSWTILQQDRELLALPVMSFVATLIAVATFAVPAFALGNLAEDGTAGPLEYVLGLAMYLTLAFITIYFQTALVAAADERLKGGDPTIGSALAAANRHLPQILVWSALSATVSIILQAIEERAGIVGRIVAGIVGVAWSLATFLVVPVYVVNDVGPIDAVKESARLLKQTWGENLISQFGFGILGFVAALAAVPVILLGVAVGGPVLVLAIVLAVLWFGLVSVTLTAMNAIFQTALYHHAAGDGHDQYAVPGGGFSQAALSGAFRRK